MVHSPCAAAGVPAGRIQTQGEDERATNSSQHYAKSRKQRKEINLSDLYLF
jgi:hypothetical protein